MASPDDSITIPQYLATKPESSTLSNYSYGYLNIGVEDLEIGKNYTFSFNAEFENDPYGYADVFDSLSNTFLVCGLQKVSGDNVTINKIKKVPNSENRYYTTFKWDWINRESQYSERSYLEVRLGGATIKFSKFQIEEGLEPTKYEPWLKNYYREYINFPWTTTVPTTQSGLTFTYDIKANPHLVNIQGTATAQTLFFLFGKNTTTLQRFFSKGRYLLEGGSDKAYLSFICGNKKYISRGDPVVIDIPEDSNDGYVDLRIPKDTVFAESGEDITFSLKRIEDCNDEISFNLDLEYMIK